ncbi:MAG: fructose-6-phosphate aldolase [Actinobacteria bacterium]|nr:MAG: fructose-6-phosphate aldolase [Actinomycetota bacterium]
MELFLDTANIEDIRKAASWGVISGVTTNPTLYAKENIDFQEGIKTITSIVKGPVSAEAVSLENKAIVKEAKALSDIADNVVIKIPVSEEGLAATAELAEKDIKVNMTLVFSINQAILAARAGASFVSPFVGRLDDIGHDGIALVKDMVSVYKYYGLETKVIAASIRHPLHVTQAAQAGADIATVPFSVLKSMVKHPLTDKGISRFLEDWNKLQSVKIQSK